MTKIAVWQQESALLLDQRAHGTRGEGDFDTPADRQEIDSGWRAVDLIVNHPSSSSNADKCGQCGCHLPLRVEVQWCSIDKQIIRQRIDGGCDHSPPLQKGVTRAASGGISAGLPHSIQ
ncbi:hypothetical protein [Thiospirillum jenense]|uniref:Uncharacterized protein n=1 Tax=Thiospirillum jenense TaxID=1653858 RepID=A0A839HDB6_9GAMM|nr:hypothetical protein [Thiospirillum jenense]MBB1125019.1 hypothetical protein [Thiospirillum jenense]